MLALDRKAVSVVKVYTTIKVVWAVLPRTSARLMAYYRDEKSRKVVVELC